MSLTSVLFPMPLAPTIPRIAPGGSSKLKLLKTGLPLNPFERLRTDSTCCKRGGGGALTIQIMKVIRLVLILR